MEHLPILIAGRGPAGLAAACALAADGHPVTICDPAPPEARAAKDRRTTAILQPGRDLLERAGVWDRLDEPPVPLGEMRVLDLADGAQAAFVAAQVSDRPFGWNVRNDALRRALDAAADDLGVEMRAVGIDGLTPREAEALVTLTNRARLRCDLLIGADGRESRVREAAGIGARTLRTGQIALAFTVAHDVPHASVSTEVYDRGGPLVLVPLPDAEDGPRSAVVWMMPADEAEATAALEPDAFDRKVSDRAGHVLGALSREGEIARWPILTRVADRFSAGRVALMAEAAHAVPPIGAQGMNMSLADAAALRESCEGGPARADLAAYDRRRRPDVLARVAAVTALNAAAIGTGPMTALRGFGIRTLGRLPAARNGLMRLGLGA